MNKGFSNNRGQAPIFTLIGVKYHVPRFTSMKPTDLGKNGDQLYRLFNIPAQIYIVQHCHNIGAAVRKQAEAFPLARSFVAPCQIVFMDGTTTARLLRAHNLWPATASN